MSTYNLFLTRIHIRFRMWPYNSDVPGWNTTHLYDNLTDNITSFTGTENDVERQYRGLYLTLIIALIFVTVVANAITLLCFALDSRLRAACGKRT